jgi:hypothetical protein
MKTYTISKKNRKKIEKNGKKTLNVFLSLKMRFLAPKMAVTAKAFRVRVNASIGVSYQKLWLFEIEMVGFRFLFLLSLFSLLSISLYLSLISLFIYENR